MVCCQRIRALITRGGALWCHYNPCQSHLPSWDLSRHSLAHPRECWPEPTKRTGGREKEVRMASRDGSLDCLDASCYRDVNHPFIWHQANEIGCFISHLTVSWFLVR